MTPILVAGIGNIFAGDDGFGVEVANRMVRRQQPPGVRVSDFGIRGIDLVYALQSGYRAVILADCAERGHRPGTISIIEPDAGAANGDGGGIAGHGIDPAHALRLAAATGSACRRIYLVACEPLELGGEQGALGLSDPVSAAVDPAIEAIEGLIRQLLAEEGDEHDHDQSAQSPA